MGSQMSEFNKSGTMVDSPGRGMLIVVLLAALAVIATAAVIVINKERGNNAASVAPVSLPADGRPAYYTEPYWKLAAAAAAIRRNAVQAAEADDRAAGKDFEAEHPLIERGGTSIEVVVDDAAESAEQSAYFTEPYWQQAELHESGADRAEGIDAYYTERYWKMAAESLRSESADEMEWDFHVQRPRYDRP